MKLKEGDPLLVIGHSHFEKAHVINVKKGVITLNNQIKVDNTLKVLNNSKFEVKPFDQTEYDHLISKSEIPKLLSKITSSYQNLPSSSMIMVKHKLERIIKKYF